MPYGSSYKPTADDLKVYPFPPSPDRDFYTNTLRGRLIVWWGMCRYWLKTRPHALAWWIAWHLPRHVALMALVRVASGASTGEYSNTNPSELTYSTMYQRFEKGAGR